MRRVATVKTIMTIEKVSKRKEKRVETKNKRKI